MPMDPFNDMVISGSEQEARYFLKGMQTSPGGKVMIATRDRDLMPRPDHTVVWIYDGPTRITIDDDRLGAYINRAPYAFYVRDEKQSRRYVDEIERKQAAERALRAPVYAKFPVRGRIVKALAWVTRRIELGLYRVVQIFEKPILDELSKQVAAETEQRYISRMTRI